MCLDFFVTDCEATKEQKSLLEKGENCPSPAWIQQLNIVWLLRHYYNYFGAFACDISSRLLQLYVTQWNKTCFCGVVRFFSSRLQLHHDFCCQTTVVRDLISYISLAAALRPPLFWLSRRGFDGWAFAYKSVHYCHRDTLTHMGQWSMLMIARSWGASLRPAWWRAPERRRSAQHPAWMVRALSSEPTDASNHPERSVHWNTGVHLNPFNSISPVYFHRLCNSSECGREVAWNWKQTLLFQLLRFSDGCNAVSFVRLCQEEAALIAMIRGNWKLLTLMALRLHFLW